MAVPSAQKEKRILWLINHTTLREFEVPLLISLGYEVYTPKRLPNEVAEWSGSISYTDDASLTLPPAVIAELNQHDFYDGRLTNPIAALLNQYFATAICVFYPKLLEQMTRHFQGRIILRAFGLVKKSSYEKVIVNHLGSPFFARLQALKKRFWFGQAYSTLDEIEQDVLRSRAVYLPIGLPQHFFKHQNTWVGGVQKILFFCPRIHASPTYYGKIYRQFKRYFGHFPYRIAGQQPIPVADTQVAGKQARAIIDEWLRTHAVMFYHSKEPRHLHYHPLEAVIFGMPLIYMRGGLLEQLGGKTQPGACATFKEAQEKIKRILAGDELFIATIRKEQMTLLHTFTANYNRQWWQKNFVEKVMATPIETLAATKKNPRTIAVLLPEGYRGGTLEAAKNIAKMLHLGSEAAGEPAKIIFSCLANTYDMQRDFADLTLLGITVRETNWKSRLAAKIKLAMQFCGQSHPLKSPRYLVPTDGQTNFNDCDFWLVISDRLQQPIAPLKPYGMVIYDYIQRYVPAIFPPHFSDDAFLAAARDADFVLTTTPGTRDDAIQYAGVASSRVHLAPMEFNPLNEIVTATTPAATPYFLWTSNATAHKNHENALKALALYYTEFAGQLQVIMTGVDTDLFSQDEMLTAHLPYVNHIRQVLAANAVVKKHLIIKGHVNVKDYLNLIKHAQFLWHPTRIDNGTFAVIEAAYHGVPSLSSYYPQMHYINQRFQLNLRFCDAMQPHAMATQLKAMETEHLQQRAALPSTAFLEQFTYQQLAPAYWQLLRDKL